MTGIPRFRASPRALSIAAAALLASWLIARSVGLERHPLDSEMAYDAVVTAVGNARPIQARLTGGFQHGVWRPDQTGAARMSAGESQVRIVAARLQTGPPLTATRAAGTRAHALGVAHLVLGEADAAVTQLEESVAAAPDDGRFQSDLAAAYLTRAQNEGRPEDYPRAIAAADRALRAAPTLGEAKFNLALALDAIGLAGPAQSSWTRFIEHDRSSAWAGEAREHLQRLEPRAKGTTPPSPSEMLAAARAGDTQAVAQWARDRGDVLRDVFDDDLLPAWGTARLRGDTATARSLALTCDMVASTLATASGDLMPRDLCREVDAASSVGSRRDRGDALASGFVEFGRARVLYGQDKIAEAGAAFLAARRHFEKSGSRQADWCALHEAIAAYYTGAYEAVRQRLAPIVERARTRSYRRLEARGHWMLGLTALQKTDYGSVLQHYRHSLDTFTAAGDATNALAVGNLLSELMMHLADERAEWNYRVEGLRHMDTLLSPRRTHTLLIGSANSCLRRGLPEAAVHFARAALDLAQQVSAPAAELEARIFMARTVDPSGGQAAEAHLTAARQLLANLPSGPLAARMATELTLADAYVHRDAPDAGVERLSEAIAVFERQGALLRTSRLHGERAAAFLRRGDLAGAEQDLLAATSRFAQARATLPRDQSLQLSHFEDGWPVFAQLVELRAKQHRYEEAAAIARRGRLLSLPDPGASAVDGSTTPIHLPAGTALVSYVVLNDRLLMWSTQGTATVFAERTIDRKALRVSIDRFRRDLRDDRPEWRQRAAELHGILIAPIGASLAAAAAVWIVPDDALASLPFPALIDPKDGRCLIDRYEIAFATESGAPRPSTRPARSGEVPALVIDAGAEGVTAQLPVLHSAAREAVDVAGMFPGAISLRGPMATRTAVLGAAARGPRVIHFAGHAVANAERPLTGRLILAGGEPLFAYEIADDTLNGTDVVLLSACTSLGGPVAGAGLVGLSSSLIAAGARTVIGTLWDVEDEAAATFARAFYRRYDAGAMSAAGAFRAALVEIRADPRWKGRANWAVWAMVERSDRSSE